MFSSFNSDRAVVFWPYTKKLRPGRAVEHKFRPAQSPTRCTPPSRNFMQDIIFERFKTQLDNLGLSIDEIDDDGFMHIECGENTLKISLDNVRKSYEQDGTFDHLDNLVNSIKTYLTNTPIPGWEISKEKVFLSLYPSDFDYEDFINEKVTEDFHKYYVYYEDEQYFWLNYRQLDEWNIDEQEFKNQVDKNMASLLEKSRVEIVETKSKARLAYFETEIDGLKAALLFSKNLKKKVSPLLGFPIYCVLPVRDFCYMFGEKDKDELVNSLGATVLEEYKNSGYEITTEIIKISENGIETIGKYK